MQMFQAGGDVTLRFDLVNENGDPIEPVSVAWRLLDDFENEVVAEQAIAGPYADTFINVTVPGANNALIPTTPDPYTGVVYPNTVQARTIELKIVTASDVIYLRQTYGVMARQRLVILVNSFQTLTQAELEAAQIAALEDWASATETEKVNAMAEAFRRLTKFGYAIRNHDAMNTLVYGHGAEISPLVWETMDATTFLTYYPERFRAALRRAQVSEADYILGGDPELRARSGGVIMEQIGQSKVQYMTSKPLDLSVHRRTLNFLKGYITYRQTTSRS